MLLRVGASTAVHLGGDLEALMLLLWQRIWMQFGAADAAATVMQFGGAFRNCWCFCFGHAF